MASLPLLYPISSYQRQTEVIPIIWNASGSPVNITGYSATMGVWNEAPNNRTLIDTVTAGAGASPVLGITMTLGTTNGTITITLPTTLVTTLNDLSGNPQYDLIMVSPTNVATALLHGPINLELGRPS